MHSMTESKKKMMRTMQRKIIKQIRFAGWFVIYSIYMNIYRVLIIVFQFFLFLLHYLQLKWNECSDYHQSFSFVLIISFFSLFMENSINFIGFFTSQNYNCFFFQKKKMFFGLFFLKHVFVWEKKDVKKSNTIFFLVIQLNKIDNEDLIGQIFFWMKSIFIKIYA